MSGFGFSSSSSSFYSPFSASSAPNFSFRSSSPFSTTTNPSYAASSSSTSLFSFAPSSSASSAPSFSFAPSSSLFSSSSSSSSASSAPATTASSIFGSKLCGVNGLDTKSEESINSIKDFQNCKKVDDNNCFNLKKLEGCETPEKISEPEENNIGSACHTDIDQKQHEILLHLKTLDSVTKDSVPSVCFGGTSTVNGGGPNTVATDHLARAQPKSQVASFIETPNAQTPNVTVSLDKDNGEELSENVKSNVVLPATVDNSASQTNLTTDDKVMEAFYAFLDAETSVFSLSNDNRVVSELTNITMPSEETQKALMTLQDFLTKDFSVLLQPDEYSTMKTTLDYLTNLPAEDGISVQIRSMIVEVSRQFTCWSSDYTHEGKKIESTSAKLLKADELEEGLEANKTFFREIMYLENELCNELAYLEDRKKELEEQINAVRANISASQAAKNMAAHTKREIFGKAKILKAQRDELREQVSCFRDEQELAKTIQANIRAEWSKLGEKFNNSLKHEE